MKKLLALSLTALMLISLAACGDTTKKEDTSKSGENITVDNKLLSVSITLPAKYVENDDGSAPTQEDLDKVVKEKGMKKAVLNEDGSVTYTMSKAKQKELLKGYKKDLDDSINEVINGEDKIESFSEIKYNDDLTEFKIYVDKAKYGQGLDTLYTLAVYMQGSYYQIFAGVPSDKIDVKVSYIDKDTGDVLDSGSLKDMAEQETEAK